MIYLRYDIHLQWMIYACGILRDGYYITFAQQIYYAAQAVYHIAQAIYHIATKYFEIYYQLKKVNLCLKTNYLTYLLNLLLLL